MHWLASMKADMLAFRTSIMSKESFVSAFVKATHEVCAYVKAQGDVSILKTWVISSELT